MKRLNKLLSIIVTVTLCLTISNAKGPVNNDPNKEIISFTLAKNVLVPKNPKRVVLANIDGLEIMDALGVGNSIVGMIKGGVPTYLKKYVDNKNIQNIGSMKNLDVEKVKALNPDVIILSGRAGAKYDEFAKIAPTLLLAPETSKSFFDGYSKNINSYAKMFGKQKEAKELIKQTKIKIDELAKLTKDKTYVMPILLGENKTFPMGDTGKAALLDIDLKMNNLGTTKSVNLRDPKVDKYKFILDQNPEYIVVLDKLKATSKEGKNLKDNFLNNQYIKQTNAFKNNKIIFIEPAAWYVSDGGINSVNSVLDNLSKHFK